MLAGIRGKTRVPLSSRVITCDVVPRVPMVSVSAARHVFTAEVAALSAPASVRGDGLYSYHHHHIWTLPGGGCVSYFHEV